MKYQLSGFVILSLIFLMGCTKDAGFLLKEYPIVVTNKVVVNSENAILSAKLEELGSSKILIYGFVWSEHTRPTKEDDNKLFENDLTHREFSYTINTNLKHGVKYYVRSYVKTAKYEVYGPETSFISHGSLPPVISSFSPAFGSIGTQVIIIGENFSKLKGDNIVKFGNIKATIDSIIENKIYLRIPEIQKPEKVNISVETDGKQVFSSDLFDLWYPWDSIATVKIDITNPASFVISTKGYIINANSTVLTLFDPISGKLSTGINLPENSEEYPLAAASAGYAYALLNSNLYKFNPDSNTWQLKYKFTYRRLRTDFIFILNNEVYIFFAEDQSFSKFDEISQIWISKKSPPSPGGYDFSYNSFNNEGYIFDDSYWKRNSHKYNPISDLWAEISEIPSGEKFMPGQFFINNKIYTNTESAGVLWQLDISNNKWKRMHDCPAGRWYPAVNMTIDGKGYAFISSFGKISTYEIWEFTPEKN